jgi:hypothetical protein
VQPVDYERIIGELRASQEKLLANELKKRDTAQSKELQRLRSEIAYLDSVQAAIRRETYENASSIQLLAQKSESQD